MTATPAHLALDTNRLWEDALHTLRSNREVMLVLAGVFVLLPTLAILFFWPFPEPKPDELFAVFLQRIGTYSDQTWWQWVAVLGLQTLGVQTMLTVIADPSRPTVKAALVKAVAAFASLFAAIVAVSVLASLVLSIVIAVGSAFGSFPLALLATVLGTVAALYLLARFALIAPLVQLEGIRNPFAALRQSLALTRGCGWQLLGFMVLLYIAVYVVAWLAGAVILLFASLFAPADALQLLQKVLQALSQAAMVPVFAGVLAGLYRQLGGAAA
ncbi:MAG: hypothetical protein WBL74_06735 [Novosphingobium sp.]|uniref:hypothetical protein n=1 Tax=Novosphingobium sp. TaxID=1874826 RepID=UPI003C7C309D